MAVMDASGFTIRLQNAALSNATSNVVGQCLTIGDQTLARYTNENQAQIGYKIGKTLQSLFNLMLIRQIDPLLHAMDGLLAYFSGVIHGMGQVLMAQFVSQCNPPEIYLSDVVKCACNDTALAIPDARASQTWRDYALWCSGTLSMVDGSNNPFVVFNPYSYAQLQAMAHGMKEVEIRVKGPGSGRESAIRALQAIGLGLELLALDGRFLTAPDPGGHLLACRLAHDLQLHTIGRETHTDSQAHGIRSPQAGCVCFLPLTLSSKPDFAASKAAISSLLPPASDVSWLTLPTKSTFSVFTAAICNTNRKGDWNPNSRKRKRGP